MAPTSPALVRPRAARSWLLPSPESACPTTLSSAISLCVRCTLSPPRFQFSARRMLGRRVGLFLGLRAADVHGCQPVRVGELAALCERPAELRDRGGPGAPGVFRRH